MLAACDAGSFAGRMFLIELKRMVSYWLMPFPFCVVLMLAGLAVLRLTTWRRAGRALLVGGLALLMLAGNHFVSRGLLRPLEKQYPAIPDFVAGQPLPPALADCKYVMVLGGGGGFTPNLPGTSLISSAALGRVVEGSRIIRMLPEARLVVSGPLIVDDAPSHASMLAHAAMVLGVPRERILFIDNAHDTEDEARALRKIAGDAPVAIVTSAWHMPRSMALFRNAGVKGLACPADFRTHDLDSFGFSDLLWDVENLGRTTLAVRERIGYLWITLKGKTKPAS